MVYFSEAAISLAPKRHIKETNGISFPLDEMSGNG